MTLLTLTLAAAVSLPHAPAPTPAWLKLGEAATDGSSWSATVGAPRRALADATRVVSGVWVVLHLPWVRSSKRQITYTSGPVEAVRVKPVPRGTVVMFRPRAHSAEELLERMLITHGNPSTIRFAGDSRTTVASAVADPPAALDLASSEPAPEPLFASPAPPAQPKQSPPRTVAAAAEPSHAGMRLGAAFLMLIAIATAVVWYRKRRHQADSGDPTIDVVAMRSIGNKYRLVLVDACGERLLLAATDKEVHMLRSMPANSNTIEFAKTLREQTDGLTDVEGLLRLQENRRHTSSNTTEGVAA